MARRRSLGRTAVLLTLAALAGCEEAVVDGTTVPRTREEQDAAIEAARQQATAQAKAAQAEAQPDPADIPASAKAPPPEVVEPPPEPAGPVRLSGLRVNSGKKKRRRKSWPLQVRIKAEALEPLGGTAYLHVKASCAAKGQVFVDVAEFRHAKDASKSIDAFTVGKREPLVASLFGLGRVSRALPCKLEFKLGGRAGAGLHVELGEACWNGRKATMGRCKNSVAPAVTSGFTVPIEVTAIKRAEQGDEGVRFDYAVLFHEQPPTDAHLWLKGACEIGDKVYVYAQDTALPTAAFAVQQFESVARSAWLFPRDVFGHSKGPARCDLTLWQSTRAPDKAGVWIDNGHYAACLREDEVVKGRCDGKKVAANKAVALDAGNVELDGVALQLTKVESAETFELKIDADVTASARLALGYRFVAQTTCNVRRKKKRRNVDLLARGGAVVLSRGETMKVGGLAFAGAPIAAPGWCQVTFKGFPQGDSDRGQVSLGTYCVKNNAVRKRKC